MDLKEYVLPKNSMMGGWYIPHGICDDLITLFKDSEGYQQPGVVGPPLRIDPDEKRSTEVPLHPSYNHPTFMLYQKLLESIIHLYEKKYPEVEALSKFGLVDACQIQYYKKGEGYKKWHFERTNGKQNRCLVFMTYLNDVTDGGTHFKYQDLTTPAEKGLTLIWPTDFTHTHKGQITDKHEKYIITGWLGFDPHSFGMMLG